MSTIKVTNLRHESATSDNISLTSTNRVGIGTSSPAVTVHAEAAQAELQLKSTSGTNSAGLRFVPGGETNALYIYADGSRNINIDNHATSIASFRAGGGLTFNGDTSTDNALDDYEEGTWTARLRFGNTTEIGTYNSNSSAEYVKIGKIVHVSGFTRYDSVNTGNSGLLVMDLPFSVDEHGQPHNWVYPGSAVPSHSDLMTKGFFALCGNASGARSRFGFYNSTSGSIDYVENGDLSGWNGNTRYLHFNFSYQTNA